MLEGPGWYPINPATPPLRTVAICQRANVSYADRLLRTTAIIWQSAVVFWALITVGVALVSQLSFATILMGIFIPLLPSLFDATVYVQEIRKAATTRAAMASDLTQKIESNNIDADDLLVWQERIHDLRRETPEVPDWIYKLQRRRNEQAMHGAAHQLESP